MSSVSFEVTLDELLDIVGHCSYGPKTNIIEFVAVAAVIINGICLLILKNSKGKIGLIISFICLALCIAASASMIIESLFNSFADTNDCGQLNILGVASCDKERYVLGAFLSLSSVFVCGLSILAHF